MWLAATRSGARKQARAPLRGAANHMRRARQRHILELAAVSGAEELAVEVIAGQTQADSDDAPADDLRPNAAGDARSQVAAHDGGHRHRRSEMPFDLVFK